MKTALLLLALLSPAIAQDIDVDLDDKTAQHKIQHLCLTRYPDDYDMREWCERNQWQGVEKLRRLHRQGIQP